MEKQKTPSLVTMGILTLITILFWIGFNAYRAFTTDAPVKVPNEILEPISPTLDTETLGKIDTRVFFEEQELPETSIISPTPSPSPTEIPESEPLSEEETATESAETQATESGELE